MSKWQEGYEKGYKDGSSGEPSSPICPFAYGINSAFDKDLADWEKGYEEGWEDGRDEYENSQGL